VRSAAARSVEKATRPGIFPARMVPIRLERLERAFGATIAVRGVDLAIPAGSLHFLLGPSGCGKTTILRMIAGFLEPTGGRVLFGDRDVTALAAEKRNAGMVFQSYALWPHLSVFENVAFGLRVRRESGAEVSRRVGEALEMVRMSEFAERKPNQLSGGQQQRVALARAIVFKPEVLLLDEPLSNLDAKLRLEMRHEIRRICSEIRMTTVYVTHDRDEAMSLADGVVVLRDGRIEQTGAPRDLYERPANRFVAEFLGEANFLDGRIGSMTGSTATIDTPLGSLRSEAASTGSNDRGVGAAAAAPTTGSSVLVCIRPEAFRIVAPERASAASNRVEGRVESTTYLGDTAQHRVLCRGAAIAVTESNPRRANRGGESISLDVDPSQVVLLPGG